MQPNNEIGARSPRILIVDDDSDLAETLKMQFELSGFYAKSALSGHQALRLFDHQDFDVVLSDIRMPDGDGIELLDSLRANGVKAPFVAMSGFAKPDWEASNTQPSARVSKPFDWQDLYSIICQFVSCPSDSAQS
jgi:DNA-binding NtrC family response regulator